MEVRPTRIHGAGFTLLELLGVMLCIFLLWGMINSAAVSMVQNGRRRQAAADVQTLATAVLSYRQEYGHFPDQEGMWETDLIYCPEGIVVPTGVTKVDASRLMQCLSNTNEVDNPRGIVFLEDPPSRMKEDVFLDPWSDAYIVVADANADGWIGIEENHSVISPFKVTDATKPGKGEKRTHDVPGIRDSVYVFSWGNSFTNAITSAGGFE